MDLSSLHIRIPFDEITVGMEPRWLTRQHLGYRFTGQSVYEIHVFKPQVGSTVRVHVYKPLAGDFAGKNVDGSFVEGFELYGLPVVRRAPLRWSSSC